MQSSLALISALSGVVMAIPQGVTDKLTPTGPAPAGCTGTFDGTFEISVAQVTEQKRSIPEVGIIANKTSSRQNRMG
jgi:hypothetical protein